MSVNWTFLAVDAPWLVTVTVNVTFRPLRTGSGSPTLVISTSDKVRRFTRTISSLSPVLVSNVEASNTRAELVTSSPKRFGSTS